MPTPPRVRVVVQLPYNRPDEPHPNPPHVRILLPSQPAKLNVLAVLR